MKKQWIGFMIAGMLVAAVPTNVNAEDCYLNWSYSADYTKLDDTYHQAEYYCYYCNAKKTEKEKHTWLYEEILEDQYDANYHTVQYECMDCGAVKTEKQAHSWEDEDYDEYYTYYYENKKYHTYEQKCEECNANRELRAPHRYFSFYDKIAKYATFNKKGILVYSCIDCDGTKKVYKKWKSGTDYSRNYDIKHGTVFNRQTSITVKLKRPSKGTVLQATIGTKKYKKKIKNNKKTVKLNIKPAEYGEKIKLALYYKGKKIGKDSCDYNDEVWYSNRVTEGMTQKQVRYTWGAPSSTSSSSYGFTYWNWDDGSMVSFRNGVVDYWFDAAN